MIERQASMAFCTFGSLRSMFRKKPPPGPPPPSPLPPLPKLGSGTFTPFLRMHWANLSAASWNSWLF